MHLEEYTYEEKFMEIVRRLLNKKYSIDSGISEKISYEVWYTMKSKDVRDAIRIAKLADTSDDVNWLIDVQVKYGMKERILSKSKHARYG